jgi:hypothetical protein
MQDGLASSTPPNTQVDRSTRSSLARFTELATERNIAATLQRGRDACNLSSHFVTCLEPDVPSDSEIQSEDNRRWVPVGASGASQVPRATSCARGTFVAVSRTRDQRCALVDSSTKEVRFIVGSLRDAFSPALCSPARADSRKRPARSPVALNSPNLPFIVGSSFVPAHGLPRCPHQGRRVCGADGPLSRRTPAPVDRSRPQRPGTVIPPTDLRQARGLLATW